MELNHINSINTPNTHNNTNKNNITSADIHSNINKLDTESVKFSDNNLQSYTLDISSNSSQKSKENSFYVSSSNTGNSTDSHAINDTYMADIVKKSHEKSIPNGVKIDDVSWGLLIELGEQIGLNDPEKISKLTVKDIEAYFYTKNIVEYGKDLLKDNITANEYVKYKNFTFDSENYWKNVFDKNGNKLNYSIYTINQSGSGLSISPSEFFSNKGNIKLTDLSAASIHNILIANENKDTTLFTYAVKNAVSNGKEKTIAQNQKEMIETYNTLQEYAANISSVYDQMQIIVNTMKKSNLSYYSI